MGAKMGVGPVFAPWAVWLEARQGALLFILVNARSAATYASTATCAYRRCTARWRSMPPPSPTIGRGPQDVWA